MEGVCDEYMNEAKKEESSGMISGLIDGTDRFELFISRLKSIGISFCVRTSTESARKNKQNEFPIKFDSSGCPYTIVKRIYYGCVYGQEYYKRGPTTEDKEDHPYGKKHRVRSQNTKKLGCDAHLAVKQIHVFIDEEFRLHESKQNSQWMKQKISAKLKEQLRGDGTAAIMRYKVTISTHHNHPVTDDTQATIHSDLVARIKELVSGGTTSIKNIKIHLRKKVKELFAGKPLPDQFDVSYYPTEDAIHNHVFLSLFRLNSNRFDQDELEDAIQSWSEASPDSKFHFRPYIAIDDDFPDGNSLLFCYQALWQQNMMQVYGNSVCLLDTTHKTTKYNLPLFFIVVKTNVEYVVAGTFVCHTRSTRCITEALRVFAEWNPTWRPSVFLTDHSEEETNAITAVFGGCAVCISAFHREQAWSRWLQKRGNVQHGSSDELLSYFRAIAHAETEERFNEAFASLGDSDVWKLNAKVQSYFTSVWLPENKRWVNCFAERTCVDNVNITDEIEIEHQYKILKDSYVRQSADKSLTLSAMLKAVIDEYLVESYQIYCENNFDPNVEEYEVLPEFLNDRPLPFIKHVIERYVAARAEYSASDVEIVGEGVVHVRCSSSTSPSDRIDVNVVDFDSVSCTCADFEQYRCPCKHFCAAFLYADGYTFDRLPKVYRNNPVMCRQFDVDVTESDKACTIEEMSLADTVAVPIIDEVESLATNDVLSTKSVIEEQLVVVEDKEEVENQQPNENAVEKLQESIRDVAREIIKVSYSSTDLDLMERTRYFLLSGANLLRSGLKQTGDGHLTASMRKKPRLALHLFASNRKSK